MTSPSSPSYVPSGRIYLLLAILIFGIANAVTRKLTELGAAHLIDGRNPISFCNVLFAGNLCALILLGTIYQRQWRPHTFQQLNPKQWLAMIAVAILGAAIAPTLIFTALSLTSVNNVILIGRVEPPLILALSVWLLRERVNAWVLGGACLSFLGVALTILLPTPEPDQAMMNMGLRIGRGEFLTAIAAITLAISTIISKVSLKQIPLGFFSSFRMLIGTLIFFSTTVLLYGPIHFRDLTVPVLWQWMLLYGAVIVVGGQLCWFNGLKRSTASEVSLASSFNPIAGVLAAYFILGETPTIAQYIGGSVILVGIILNQIGVQKLNIIIPQQQPSDKEITETIGFKGL
ncbi:DMT family transporter [Spirulina subsalsa]|uniref:DMT family transporter n=1 Tax=Spirulina subsalsa TaxID=54311 RepID=UPI00031C77E3|nr:DMT family transporter [Spirulina subsalsa]